MGAAHKLPISNSSTTSAKFQLTLRMCVPFPTLLLRVQLSYGCVWGGRVQGGCPSPACGRRRRRWRWAAGGGRACRPAAPPNGGGRSTAAAGCGNRCYGGGSSGARSVCVRQECAARRRSSRLVGWRAGGGLWRRCERRAWSPPLSVGRRGGSALCGGGRAKVPAAMMWRELCAGGERGGCTSRLDQRDSASLTIATADSGGLRQRRLATAASRQLDDRDSG